MTKKGWHDACTENPVMGVGRFKGSSVFGIQQQQNHCQNDDLINI